MRRQHSPPLQVVFNLGGKTEPEEDRIATERLKARTKDMEDKVKEALTAELKGELLEELVEALNACVDRLEFIHRRLVPHDYARVADPMLHEDVDKIRGCIGMANTALDSVSRYLAGSKEPPA